ncbi:hypothetical protein Leryth_009519, partial [Lithospermum erythrorhizon]
MQVANLDTARGEILEHTRELGISQGLVVEKILSGSPAETSGVHPGDVIIKCSNTMVVSSLEVCFLIPVFNIPMLQYNCTVILSL